jgi:hypothetical protein
MLFLGLLALSLWLFEGGWPLKLIIAICKRLAPYSGYLELRHAQVGVVRRERDCVVDGILHLLELHIA